MNKLKEIAQQFILHADSIVEVCIEGNHIGVYPKKHALSDMLQKINKHNIILKNDKVKKSKY